MDHQTLTYILYSVCIKWRNPWHIFSLYTTLVHIINGSPFFPFSIHHLEFKSCFISWIKLYYKYNERYVHILSSGWNGAVIHQRTWKAKTKNVFERFSFAYLRCVFYYDDQRKKSFHHGVATKWVQQRNKIRSNNFWLI